MEAVGLDASSIWMAVDTDIDLEGRTQRHWLAIAAEVWWVLADPPMDTQSTSNSVLNSPGFAAKKPFCVATSEVKGVRTTAGVGAGLLQILVDGQWLDVLRFTNTLSHRFHRVSRLLESLINGEELSCDLAEVSWDLPRCPGCGFKFAAFEGSCPRCLQRGRILHRVMTLLQPHWRGAVTLCVLTVLGVWAELIPPRLQQYMVDHLLTNRLTDDSTGDIRTALLVVVLALTTSRVVLSVVGVIKGHLATVIGSELTCQLRTDMVQKLQTLAVSYYDRHQVGSMISHVAHDSEVLQGLMHQLTGGFLLQAMQLLGVGAMLVWLNPRLALFTLIPVPLVFLGSWVYWRIVYPRYFRLWDASSKQMTVLSDILSGIRVVKAFAQEEREFERFRSSAEQLRDWRRWVDDTSSRYAASMQLVFSLGGLIVWYVGGREVIGRDMTLGELIAFLAYLSMFYAPLGALSNFTTWLTSFLSGSKRVLELLETPAAISEAAHTKPWSRPCGAVSFEHVTFGYEVNQPVLKDVSFDVRPGELIGVVGRSGSGKTTMVNLLGRFYDVQEGAISVDGIDLRDLSLHELREHLGIVCQEVFLFRGSIWNNLAYGRPGTQIEKGLTAAKVAGAHDFICRTQLGYETPLGEHGSGLSGGEKQRLSITRTLLYDPKILVLDEATSNIDLESEKAIQQGLKELIKGRTTIAIAHRLSTLRNADRILVFDQGRLVEQGTHVELLSADGVYARLVRIQNQVLKDPPVDRFVQSGIQTSTTADTQGAMTDSATTEFPQDLLADHGAGNGAPTQLANQRVWLDPSTESFRVDDEGQICLARINGLATQERVFVIATFPASCPNEYLSVRTWTDEGSDEEIGLIRNLKRWPAISQDAVRRSLQRRYLFRRIQTIHSLRLIAGYLEFDVECETGRSQFTMRWTQSRAVEFSDNGKLLMDVDDNRYLVPNVDQLSRRDRERFLRYIYW